jgi:hypothetical protein
MLNDILNGGLDSRYGLLVEAPASLADNPQRGPA